jgi:hypothetical protein
MKKIKSLVVIAGKPREDERILPSGRPPEHHPEGEGGEVRVGARLGVARF